MPGQGTQLYQVAAPMPADVLRVTLHRAYAAPDQNDAFADLLRALDRVPTTPRTPGPNLSRDRG